MHLVVSYANYLPFWWIFSAHVAWRNMKFSADKSDHLGSRLPWRYGLLWSDDISRLAWNLLYLHCPLGKHPTSCTASDHLWSLWYPGGHWSIYRSNPIWWFFYTYSSIPTCFRLNITRTQGCFSYILSGSRCSSSENPWHVAWQPKQPKQLFFTMPARELRDVDEVQYLEHLSWHIAENW